MRGEGQRSPFAQCGQLVDPSLEEVQPIGIDERRQSAGRSQDPIEALSRHPVPRQARTDDHGVCPFPSFGHGCFVINIDKNRFGHCTLIDLPVGGVRGDAHDPRAHGQRRLGCQHAGPGHAAPPHRQQQVAGVTLMRIRLATR